VLDVKQFLAIGAFYLANLTGHADGHVFGAWMLAYSLGKLFVSFLFSVLTWPCFWCSREYVRPNCESMPWDSCLSSHSTASLPPFLDWRTSTFPSPLIDCVICVLRAILIFQIYDHVRHGWLVLCIMQTCLVVLALTLSLMFTGDTVMTHKLGPATSSTKTLIR
jgi:hypothetical protein